MTTEQNWEKIFRKPEPALEFHFAKKCKCGNKNCRTAKRIRCVCSCHSENHGIEQRRGMEPLDKVLGLEKERPLGDLALGLELSGALELERPALVPWLEVC